MLNEYFIFHFGLYKAKITIKYYCFNVGVIKDCHHECKGLNYLVLR